MSLSRRTFTATTLAAIALSVSAGAMAQEDKSLQRVLDKKSIALGIPTDYPPYGFMGPDFKPTGVDVATAQLIADKLGVKAEFVPLSTPNRIPYLQANKIDLIVSALGKTPEREKVIDFTIAYSPFFQAVFAPKSMPLASFADLAGKSVGVTRGAIEDQELSKVAPAGADIKRFEDNNATVSAFVSGQVQVIATGASVAGNMMARNPQLNTEYKLLLKDSPNFIGVAKGEDALRTKVNEVILAAKKAGDLDTMAKKWLGRPAGTLPE